MFKNQNLHIFLTIEEYHHSQSKISQENDSSREREKKDTEEVSFPPIKHVEPERDIVKVDFSLNPVHIWSTSYNQKTQTGDYKSGLQWSETHIVQVSKFTTQKRDTDHITKST